MIQEVFRYQLDVIKQSIIFISSKSRFLGYCKQNLKENPQVTEMLFIPARDNFRKEMHMDSEQVKN